MYFLYKSGRDLAINIVVPLVVRILSTDWIGAIL